MTQRTNREARMQLAGMLPSPRPAPRLLDRPGRIRRPTGRRAALRLARHPLRARRGGTLETMSGVGDERTRVLAQRATAFTGNAMALVLAAWGLVAAAAGEFNTTIGILSLIFAVIWVGASAVYSRRG